MPKISIVMPVYNGEKYLRLSIESILKQTFTDWELILVNDCSTDSSLEIMESYKDSRIRIISNSVNLKLPKSLNTGFAEACGKYFTWTSDDNIYGENALKKMSEYLDKNSECGLVYTGMYFIDENGNIDGKFSEPPEMNYNNDSVGACFMYRREAAEATGEYDPDMFLVEDYDYWIRMSAVTELHRIDSLEYYYRRHGNSLTGKRADEINRQLYKLRKKELDHILSKITDSEKIKLFIDMVCQSPKEKEFFTEKFYGGRLPDQLQWITNDRVSDTVRKKIIFGAGKFGEEALDYFGRDNVFCFTDNNPDLCGKEICGKKIISFDEYKKISSDYQTVISVSSKILNVLANQLESCGITDFIPYIMFKNNINK